MISSRGCNGKLQKRRTKNGVKLVNKSVGVCKNRKIIKRRGCVDYNARIHLYESDLEYLTPLDSLDLEIDENILKVCKIYLKQSLYNDCKLVKLNENYVEHIVELIFNLGFSAKRGHFMRDILDLISLLEVPEGVLNVLGMNRNHRLSIFRGISFKGELSHPDMKVDLKRCKVLLIRYFSSLEDDSKMEVYDSIANMSKSYKALESLAEKVSKQEVDLIVCENYVPNDVAAFLSAKKVSCVSKVGSNVMSKLSFALNCGILHSLDSDDGIEKSTGVCEKFSYLSAGVTIATLTFAEHFRGFTIFISTRMISSANLRRIEELIKISIVRLQGVVEELELIKNLNGTLVVDTSVFESDFKQNSICENFSDYLDMLLGNTRRLSVSTSSPRSNLNYFSCDIYYNKIVESDITCSEYRNLTRLQCFQYYTKMNELCTKATFETVPIGNYEEGLFFSDFIKYVTNALKINKCVASQSCSESYINHQLHFETAYSNVENMRLSLTFQISSEKYAHEGVNVKTFCSICNHSRINSIQDLTFGRFLQLMLFNRSYRAKCGHLLFFSNKFSVLAESYSITFNLSPVSIYTVCPEFNEPSYNCSADTVQINLLNETMLDRRLQILLNRIVKMVQVPGCKKRITRRTASNLYFKTRSEQARGFEYFYNRVYEMIEESIHNLVDYDIERHLPCKCKIGSSDKEDVNSRSQWVTSVKGLEYSEFMSKFEKHSAYGVELNYRLSEKLKSSSDVGSAVGECEWCGTEGYTTLADMEILNWLYILVHVINACESKMVKLKAGLSHVMQRSELIREFYECVDTTEEDLISVFQQCVALIVYFKYFCPRDPMYLFTIVKLFFVSFYNLFESLQDKYTSISHIEKVSTMKIIEYDKKNIIIVHAFGKGPVTYQKIDFINGTSVVCGDMELERMEKVATEQESYTTYNMDEFLTFSQYFAILSGIEDLSSVVTKKSAYFRVVSKIRLKNTTNQSVVCVDYKPIITPNRDVANILSNALLSKEYVKRYGSCTSTSDQNELRSKYISHMKERDIDYENYKCEEHITESERRRGLCYNYVSLRRLVRGAEECIFKLDAYVELERRWDLYTVNGVSTELRKFYTTKNVSNVNDFDDRVLSSLFGNESVAIIKTKVKMRDIANVSARKWQYTVPFYGLPVIYTNSKMLKYGSTGNVGEDGGKEDLESKVDSLGSKGYLSPIFVENGLKLNVHQKLLLKYIVSNLSSKLVGELFEKVSSNVLTSLGSVLTTSKLIRKYNLKPDLLGKEVLSPVESVSVTSDNEKLDVFWGPYCITVFYGREFRRLRNKFCGDEMNFVRSMCRSTRMKSIGKSGSPIFMTYDGKFTIKLINKHEIGLFIAQGREFFEYFKKNKTLMSLPYGLFKVTHLKTNSSINCFVMQNIDYFHRHHKISFDLKGISLKRYINISKDKVISVNSSAIYSYAHSTFSSSVEGTKEKDWKDHNMLMSRGNYVLLDQNFKLYTKGCPIQLDYDSIKTVNERLNNDLNFLSSINIVDYSLLLRISPSQSIITLGLIDFLRPYTWDKQIETVGKRLANIGQEPTIVSPNEYKTRFFNFIQRIFVYPYEIKSLKKGSEDSGDRASHENVNYTYQIKQYNQCRLCNSIKYMYSNSYFACLKYYMALLSPEIMQYLHLIMKRQLLEHSTRWMDTTATDGVMQKSEKDELAERVKLDSLVNLIQRVYESPTINWNLVI